MEILQKIRSGEYSTLDNSNSCSDVWLVFKKIIMNKTKDVVPFVICDRCKKIFKFPKGSSPSNLKKHKCYQRVLFELKFPESAMHTQPFLVLPDLKSKESSGCLDTESQYQENNETVDSINSANADSGTKVAPSQATHKYRERPKILTFKRKGTFQFPRRIKRMVYESSKDASTKTNGSCTCIKNGQNSFNKSIKDDSTSYGDYIASKHRKYSEHTKSIIEHIIADILYKADMGRYESEESSLIDAASFNEHSEAATLMEEDFIKTESTDPLLHMI